MAGYKRRTFDEALELARVTFRAQVADHLSPAEIESLASTATVGGGSVGDGWDALAGGPPDDRLHYEVEIYVPAPTCGAPSPKVYARILVPRDRNADQCLIRWNPQD